MGTFVGTTANMDKADVLEVVKERLKALNMSAKEASVRATGSETLISNLGRDRYKSPTLESVSNLAEVLNLELYFGPPRNLNQPPAPPSNAEVAWLGIHAEQLRRLPDLPDLQSLCLPTDWLNARGIDPTQGALVIASDDGMSPTIDKGAVAIINAAETDIEQHPNDVFAYVRYKEVRLRRLSPNPGGVPGSVLVNPDKPGEVGELILKGHLPSFPILGRVRSILSNL